SAGDIYRPGGGDHPEKVFSYRGDWHACQAVCGEPFPDSWVYGMHNGYGSGGGGVWSWEKGSAGSVCQQGSGKDDPEQGGGAGKSRRTRLCEDHSGDGGVLQ